MKPFKLFTDTIIGTSLGGAAMQITGDTMGKISPAFSSLTQSMTGLAVAAIPLKGMKEWLK